MLHKLNSLVETAHIKHSFTTVLETDSAEFQYRQQFLLSPQPFIYVLAQKCSDKTIYCNCSGKSLVNSI